MGKPSTKPLPFIPSWLDDAGLSLLAFRLYARILRRGECWDSRANLEREFGVGNRAMTAALAELKDRGLVIVERQIGKPSVYRPRAIEQVDPMSDSTGSKRLNPMPDNTGSDVDPMSASTATPCQPAPGGAANQQVDPMSASTTKVYPIKVNPIKDTPSKVSHVSDQKLAEEIYEAYPRKIAKQTAIVAILKAMKSHPHERLLETTRTYARAIAWQIPRYIPHPATWFNRGSYDDDPREWEDPNTRSATPAAKPRVDMGHRSAKDETIVTFSRTTNHQSQ